MLPFPLLFRLGVQDPSQTPRSGRVGLEAEKNQQAESIRVLPISSARGTMAITDAGMERASGGRTL
jgi:hypothetical protein